jgi:creatinine amidohydrolase
MSSEHFRLAVCFLAEARTLNVLSPKGVVMSINRTLAIVTLASIVVGLAVSPVRAQGRRVSDLPAHKWEEINWMRLKDIVPGVTDRAILPIGTIEAHSVDPNGSDILIPLKLAELTYGPANALIAPPVYHGPSGQGLMDMAGTIRIRPEIFEEYVYDVLKGLARWKIKNVLVINGHGGNAEPARRAAQRVYSEDGMRTMVVEWWNFRRDLSTSIYGGKPHTPGHGGLEETALNIAYNPKLIEQDLYKKIGGKELGFQEGGTGFSVFPGIASMGLPQEPGEGLPDFDVAKANEYARKLSTAMAEAFLDAIRRWDFIASHHPSGSR